MTQLKSERMILQSFPNSFKYLFDDAELLLDQARKNSDPPQFHCTQFCRTAILLYVLSLEGLINRALDSFLAPRFRRFIMEREEKFSLPEKWELLPLLMPESKERYFDKSCYPWSHFVELIKIRNALVHPKHDRVVFYSIDQHKTLRKLEIGDIPTGLTYRSTNGEEVPVKESDLVYRLNRISKDPYTYTVADVEKVRTVALDITRELDKLLEGRITNEGWFSKDKMEIIWPKGATF